VRGDILFSKYVIIESTNPVASLDMLINVIFCLWFSLF